MATAEACRRAPFTYIWTIENVSEMTGIYFKSPMFIARIVSEKEWYLQVSDFSVIECSLQFEDDPVLIDIEDIEKEYSLIDVKFSFLAADGSTLISHINNESGLCTLTRAEILERWTEFVPNNTLTVQCRIWRKGCEIATTDFCYARTRLKTFSRSFLWPVEEFSALKTSAAGFFLKLALDERKIYYLKPFTPEGPFRSFILYLKRNSESEDVYVHLLLCKYENYNFSYEILVLDANGQVEASLAVRDRKDNPQSRMKLPLTSKNKLTANKNLFLPNDTLLLKCSFEVYAGFITSEIEYCTPNVSPVVHEEIFDLSVEEMDDDMPLEFQQFFIKDANENGSVDNSVEEQKYSDSCRDLCSLKTALKYLHSEATLTDVSLRIGMELYPVHKNILCSRSPVFKRIFGKDMKENIVDINDMDENTLCHLLQYIYTNTVGDLLFENALDLYRAAADYQLLDLKDKCSDFLIINLCETNVRDIQSLANKYQDENLENRAREFAHDIGTGY